MGDIVRKLLSNSFVLFVIFIVIAIIIPLPSWLLDFMILLNISLSLIILVMTMFGSAAVAERFHDPWHSFQRLRRRGNFRVR